MKSAAAIAIPMVLILVGVLVLIGCFPIPATRQLQPNLTPRPEFYVGVDHDKPVQLGRTHMDDAFIILSKKVQAQNLDHNWVDLSQLGRLFPMGLLSHWGVSDDGRQFWVRYDIRTSTQVWPLCFQALPETTSQNLILDVNSDGIVTGMHTADIPPARQTPIKRWREVFDEATRRKLHDAGVFPSEKFFDDAETRWAEIERMRQKRLAATQEFKP